MAATPLLAFVLDAVKLRQDDSLEPSLAFLINVKFRSNGNNTGISRITLLRVNTKVFVSTSAQRGQELGLAESWQHVTLPAVGADLNMELNLSLSPHSLHKIESLRGGGDLYYFTYAQLNAFGTIVRDNTQTTDIIWVNADQERERFKYSKSEWISDLNATDAKSMIFDMPTVSLPDLPLTAEVTRFLDDAEGSFKDGRWGDVFGECRKALNALYNGIDDWGANQELTKDESESIQAQGEKASGLRNVYFSRLMAHPEKGERLNRLRNSLYQYLSLDPHEPDHKGVVFTRDDAMLALRITYGFAANVLHSLALHMRVH